MPSKYKRGEQIMSLDDLARQEFIFCNNKVLHLGWFQRWTLKAARELINNNCLFKAIKKTEDK